MSEIGGSGYGDKHNWKKGKTISHGAGDGNIFTEWHCEDCKQGFRHFYRRDENIFDIMELNPYITEECIKEQTKCT